MSLPMYDRAIALIAGNILSGQGTFGPPLTDAELLLVAERAVRMARAIVAEVERTELKEQR